MKTTELKITIRDLVKRFSDKGENGVLGYNEQLNIRPAYQREFIYPIDKQEKVITSIMKGFPINMFYWNTVQDGYELLDGQQRTMSICKFVNGEFDVDTDLGRKFFKTMSIEEQEQILNYEIMVCICTGTELEILKWFNIINIGSTQLNQQELRNACYTGAWLTSAKKKFSANNCHAIKVGSIGNKPLVSGAPSRQEILEKVLVWITDCRKTKDKVLAIEGYMADNRDAIEASELWDYYRDVMEWVKNTFTTYRKEMKNVDWGLLYNLYKDVNVNTADIEVEISNLMADEDVTRKVAIYDYVLSRDVNVLNVRGFTPNQKRQAYEKQKGICAICGEHFEPEQMDADHILAWSKGGKTTSDNCQMLCKRCNIMKSNKF